MILHSFLLIILSFTLHDASITYPIANVTQKVTMIFFLLNESITQPKKPRAGM